MLIFSNKIELQSREMSERRLKEFSTILARQGDRLDIYENSLLQEASRDLINGIRDLHSGLKETWGTHRRELDRITQLEMFNSTYKEVRNVQICVSGIKQVIVSRSCRFSEQIILASTQGYVWNFSTRIRFCHFVITSIRRKI